MYWFRLLVSFYVSEGWSELYLTYLLKLIVSGCWILNHAQIKYFDMRNELYLRYESNNMAESIFSYSLSLIFPNIKTNTQIQSDRVRFWAITSH